MNAAQFKSLLHFILAFSLVVLTTGFARAQRYTFYNLNVENGLIQSQARDIVQDKQGYLWIATLGGLSRYDGRQFRNFTVRDGLPSNAITSVRATQDGSLWIGTANGLCRFDGKKFHVYRLGKQSGEKLGPVTVQTDDSGRVWFLAEGFIHSIERKKIRRYITPGTEAGISAWMPGKNGEIWAGTLDGRCIRYADRKAKTYQLAPVNGVPVLASRFYTDRKGQIWLGTTSGLMQLKADSIQPVRLKNAGGFLNNTVFCMAEDHNGAMWAGLKNGAIRIEDSTVTAFTKRNGFSDNGIPAVFQDAERNLWFASDGQGIYRYSGTQFTMLDETSGLPSAQVMCMAADRSGNLYFGTYDGGLCAYDGATVRRLDFPAGNAVTPSALAWYRGALWIGTNGAGLWRYDGTTFTAISQAKAKLASPLITRLYSDNHGRLWLSALGSVSYLKQDTFYTIPFPRQQSALDILELSRDSILFGMNNGLSLYHNGEVTEFKTNSIADSSSVQCLALSGENLWIGTSENGLVCYHLRSKKSFTLNKTNGLKSDFIYNAVTDDKRHVWVGTGLGIHKIEYTEGGVPKVHFYGRADGIMGMESNHNAVLKMRDGSIWFGTINGAYHYNPREQVVNQLPVSVMLQSVEVFGEPVTDAAWYRYKDAGYGVPMGLRLPFRKNNITFSFGAISLSAHEGLKYRYRLEGLDAPWSEWATNNTITFSALPPGKYRLQVQASTDQSDQVQELNYPFEIITPFHKTRWFRMLIFGACILLGITIQYLINQRKLARQRLIEKLREEEQAKVRQRTAEDFHDEVGNKLTRINILTNVLTRKVDMNPEAERIVRQIQENTNLLYSGTRDILWSLKPENDNLYEILHRIRDFGNELFGDTDIRFSFTGSDERWNDYKLPLDVSRNLVMIFKEALNNALKYAAATEIKLDVNLRKDNALQMVLTDDGKGFDMQYVKRGHGINNMQVRAGRIGGRIYIDSRKDKGTIINLTFRLPKKLPSNKG